MKIDKLTLKNFKFFYGEKTLNFESKNVLLYGENGSGKSSIYWALYTLLQSSTKEIHKIQNYFNLARKDIHLLNRYIESSDVGKISVVLGDDSVYTISKDKDEINTKIDTKIKEANIASDFINYRLLSKLYDFKHSQQIDLFNLLLIEVFEYIMYDTTNTFGEIWRKIKGYEDEAPDKSSKGYETFLILLEQFNNKLETFLKNIIEDANTILTDRFVSNLKITYTYSPMKYNDKSRYKKDRNIQIPKVILKIKFNSIAISTEHDKIINKPHTFLNEAKLTAIALSIRLSILRTRVTSSDILKILVLDDLLISLDMSNRDIVVNMLLEDEYLKDYQIIMLTHDRAFYERSKQIFDYKAKGKWKYFEMYVEPHETKDIEIPYIKEFGHEYGNKERAEEHFRKRDYPAAANYLRKEVEKLYYKNLDLGKLESIMELSRKVDNYEKIETCFPILMKTLKAFKKCKSIPDKEVRAKKCIIFADKVEKAFNEVYEIIKSDEFFDVGLMKDHILNPQSHDDFTKPLYKKELEDALKGVELLQQAVEKNILNRMVKKREAIKRNRKISNAKRRK